MSELITVVQGTTETVQVLRQEGGRYLILAIERDGELVQVPAELGALRILPGYEATVERILGHSLVGRHIEATWLGQTPQGLAQVHLDTQHEVHLLRRGMAVSTLKLNPDLGAVQSDYAKATLGAVVHVEGQWADRVDAPRLRAEQQALLKPYEYQLTPTFFNRSPGFSLLILVIIVAAVAWTMRSQASQESQAPAAKKPFRRRALGWLVYQHARFFKPGSGSSFKPLVDPLLGTKAKKSKEQT